jgi:hypothetical protein
MKRALRYADKSRLTRTATEKSFLLSMFKIADAHEEDVMV